MLHLLESVELNKTAKKTCDIHNFEFTDASPIAPSIGYVGYIMYFYNCDLTEICDIFVELAVNEGN